MTRITAMIDIDALRTILRSRFVPGLFGLLCLVMPMPGLTATYVVAADGDDAAVGSRVAPWATVARAMTVAEAGDTVVLRGGRYRARVYFPRSGNARDGFITLRSAAGERAVIDGRDLSIPNGEAGLVNIVDRSHIRVQGLELTGLHSDDESVPMGILVSGAGDRIQLLDNHIHRIETHQAGCEGNALGIAVYGRRAPAPLSNIVIRGNEIAHLRTGCSEALALNGNVTDFEIVSNWIHDNNNVGIDVIGHEGMAPDPRYDVARNGMIEANTVYNNSSLDNSAYPDGEMSAGGIYVDGGRAIRVERNRIHGNDIGIELASEHAGAATRDVQVRHNLIYDNHRSGLAIGGYAADTGGAVDCRIEYNTFFRNDSSRSWAGEVFVQHNARDNRFEHNIVYANAQRVFINYYVESTAMPLDSDYNLFFADGGRRASQWQWLGSYFQGMTDFVEASGNDRHSRFGHPRTLARREATRFPAARNRAGRYVDDASDDPYFDARRFELRPRPDRGRGR